MSEQSEHARQGSDKSQNDFFTVGPPLHAVRPGYIRRAADEKLFATVAGGKDAYLFAPKHSGKTSLIAATSARLQTQDYRIANLDLAQIGERDAGKDAGRWYYSIAYRLLRQLRIKVDLQEWWQDKSILSHRQRLFEFYIEVLLPNTKARVVVFIDELQTIEQLDIAQQLLESITAVNKARVTEPEFERLTFVLAGECDAARLATSQDQSPLVVMEAIQLENFRREDVDLFAVELNLPATDAVTALDRIFYWTDGQPYLTQKLARAVSRASIKGDVAAQVDQIVRNQFGSRSAVLQEPHLSHLHNRITGDRRNYESVLNLYGRIRKGIAVPLDSSIAAQRILLSIGLIAAREDGRAVVSNRLYELALTTRWANEHLPLHWRGPALAVGLLLLLTAVPFWYTQLLPRPYTRVLTSPTLDIDTISDAHRNLRSFPGHVATADRLFENLLRTRAAVTDNELDTVLLANAAAGIPGREELAEQLTAEYWDRRAAHALRDEQRDEALISSIKALVMPTPKRRRLVQSMIGEDYDYLIASVAAGATGQQFFNGEQQLLSVATGARLRQWSLSGEFPEEREPWSLSALEITPLLRRVIIDREGDVSRIGLTVNVSHRRLDDLRMRLISPSGRAAEIVFDAPTSSANDALRIPASALRELRGESLGGTWTLSIRDESSGVAGHLVGWSLSLNSQVAEESFERGLDIPEPAERESNKIWFSTDGRYAIARAQQSASARLWDLSYAQAARTLSIPASDQLLGVSGDASVLLSAGQSSVSVWNTRSGRLTQRIEVGPNNGVELLQEGKFFLLRRAEEDGTIFELWRIQDGERVSTISVAGSPAIAVADPSGTRLAVADYDRSVRLWDFMTAEVVTQFSLDGPPSELRLALGGRFLAVLFGTDGFALWNAADASQPVISRRGADSWRAAFSPSGERFVAGSAKRGFQVYAAQSGERLGPSLGSGSSLEERPLLAFSEDEQRLVASDSGGSVRLWQVPAEAGQADNVSPPAGRWLWRESADTVAALAPGGLRLAIGDIEGHLDVVDVNGPRSAEPDAIRFMGHFGAVRRLAFSADGSQIASAAEDGSIRVWDAVSGLPRSYRAAVPLGDVSQMEFSPSGHYLAIMIGQRVRILNVETGATLAEQELGERHAAMAFAANDRLYLASESGVLRSFAPAAGGAWGLRSEWRGPYPIRRIRVSPVRQLMVLVDSRNVVQVLDIGRGAIGTTRLDLADGVSDILFTRNEAQVVLRTSRWVHRADLARSGIHWRSAMRVPEVIDGSSAVLRSPAPTVAAETYPAESVMLLTRSGRFATVREADFARPAVRPVIGTRAELLSLWQQKLAIER